MSAIRAGFAEAAIACEVIDRDEAASGELVVVVDSAGAPVFEEVCGERAEWIAVELGGIGGQFLPDVEAAVSVFGRESGCYRCLRQRVAAVEPEPGDEESVPAREARFAGAIAARLAEAVLAGDRAPVGQVVELPYSERELLPVPHCACSDSQASELSLEVRDDSLEETIARAERAIDERVGIIQTIGEAHSYPVPYYLASLCSTVEFSDAAASRQAAGVAAEWDVAFMKAIGEGLERYCAGVYRTADFRTAQETELSAAVSPSRFVRPTGNGADSSRRDWEAGVALGSGDEVYLPAEYVYFPPPGKRTKPAITTGLGFETSGGGAVLAGLYEVIERDATMLAWYSSFEPLELTVDDPVFREMAKRARAEDLSVTALLVTQDIDVPVVAVAVHRETEWPRFAVGSGAALEPAVASRGALAEALQNWLELREMGPDQAAGEAGAIGEYAEFPAPAREFIDVAGSVEAAAVAPDGVASTRELDAVLERLEAVGLSAFAARVTSRDVARLGFEAVRVLVPAAQPLFTDEPFFGERAEAIPRSLGFEPRLDREMHPYP